MIISENDFKKFISEKDYILEQSKKKDRELIIDFYADKVNFFSSIDKDNLNNSYQMLNKLNGIIVDFDLLPYYYEISFCLNYRLHKTTNALIYLRSLKTCINNFFSLEIHEEYKIEEMEKIKNNYANYIKIIELEQKYEQLGKRDINLKYYLPESELKELLDKELITRCLIRKFQLTRCQTIECLKKYKN